ncbi:MAG: ATP-binding cassette domain-containing protein [Alphaproteobacteria bacterium]|nr:ATP-binding cassette domain-containing protein [Alphaproteobacteria bacterium]
MTGGTLSLDGVTIALGFRRLVDGLTLAIAPGEVVTVMGPSGSGKSTLLAYVAGFLDRRVFTASGRLRLGGDDMVDVPPERRRIGMLFQDDLLFPHLSVRGNLLFGLAPGGSAELRRARVDEALAAADLAGFGDRDPATLSGGQRARIALLRVLLSAPRALLLDEPFSKLDAELRVQFRIHVFGELRRAGLPTLMVTHDPADAAAAGGKVVAL